MSLRLNGILICLITVAVTFGCDDDRVNDLIAGINKCRANETQPCECPDGRDGMQICVEEGAAWEECFCNAVIVENCSPEPEICDNIDNDCDGFTDDNAVDIITWYQDRDGDGFGSDLSVKSCQPYATFTVTKSGDCDDNNNLIFPGNTEICDSVDNNCDGMVDDGFQLKWYKDEDGDGFGTSDFITGCNPDAGSSFTALEENDCDDTSSAIHPNAIEAECDGIDNNCDGKTDPQTYFDGTSGICWQKTPLETTMTLQAARAYCRDLDIGEATGWSLPGIDELRLLIRDCPVNAMGGFCPVTSVSDATVDTTLCSACSVGGGRGMGGCFWPEDLQGSCDDVYLSTSETPFDQAEEFWGLNYVDASIERLSNRRGLVRCMRYPAMPGG